MKTSAAEDKKMNSKKTKQPKYSDSLYNPLTPFDCTKEDYEELLEQAAALTTEEATKELLECSRYGEVDAVCAILTKQRHLIINGSNLIDATDDNGNTALHKSCANGHDPMVALLLHHKAKFTPNASGNTPLHWAAANGHKKCVELLVTDKNLNKKSDSENNKSKKTPLQIDVLQKNKFGRSALTEGFSSQNTEVVGLLLEHDSAEEERLIGGSEQKISTSTSEGDTHSKDTANKNNENNENNEKGDQSKVNNGIVHEFLFTSNDLESTENLDHYHDVETDAGMVKALKTLLIRELVSSIVINSSFMILSMFSF